VISGRKNRGGQERRKEAKRGEDRRREETRGGGENTVRVSMGEMRPSLLAAHIERCLCV
jgi:hypothetical protein